MSHALINCTCKNRLGFSLFRFTLIPQCLKRFACYRWPPRFPDISRPYGAWVKRGSGKHMFSLSLFDPRSRQSNISTSGEERSKYALPRKNKISQMPFPWPLANKDNQIPTPCPAFPPPRPPRHDIDRCIILMKLFLCLNGRTIANQT